MSWFHSLELHFYFFRFWFEYLILSLKSYQDFQETRFCYFIILWNNVQCCMIIHQNVASVQSSLCMKPQMLRTGSNWIYIILDQFFDGTFTIKLRNSWLCNLEPIIFLSKQFKHFNHSYSVDIHFDKISQIMLVTLKDSDEDVTKTFPIVDIFFS